MKPPAMMGAALVEKFDRPLLVQSRPLPVLKSDEVLVHVEACRLCRTDIQPLTVSRSLAAMTPRCRW